LLSSSRGPPSQQTLETGSKIWEWRKRGLSVYEIHMRLGIPMESVKTILEEFERHFYPDVGAAISQRLALDDARLDNLFATWLPIATAGPVEVTKVTKKGEVYSEMDSETSLRAAKVVLEAIGRRVQISVACRPEGLNGKDVSSQTNILMWLTQVMPGVQKIVNQVEDTPVSRGRQTLTLECEAEADIKSNGSKSRGSR
jgi:hypothetical protein